MATAQDPLGSSPFVDSMRVLFNILAEDDQRGVVKFADIERRWSGGDCPGTVGTLSYWNL